MKVLKFGGTSVGAPERMFDVANLITKDNEPKIVVLSALSGTTNVLVAIGEQLFKKDNNKVEELISDLYAHYQQFISNLLKTNSALTKAKAIVDEHFDYVRSFMDEPFNVAHNKALLAQGELLSTKLFVTYLEEKGIKAKLLPALDYMVIDQDGEPYMDRITAKLEEIISMDADYQLFITQGFICLNNLGEIDNLKRGGSDYSASLIGAALKAKEVQIWTDIDGMHNNDPRIVKGTHPIAKLSFNEAAELAYFGAKILHPTSVVPAQKYNVPVKLLNTMMPEAIGTTISSDESTGGGIKAIAAKDGITAVKIKSSRMLLAYGFLSKIFAIFEKFKTPIDMVTTSEIAVSLTIDNADRIKEIVKELEQLGQVEVDQNQSIICIVGDMVSENEESVKKIFGSIGHTPLRMISYGGSRHNISLLVDNKYKDEVLNSLHKGIFC